MPIMECNECYTRIDTSSFGPKTEELRSLLSRKRRNDIDDRSTFHWEVVQASEGNHINPVKHILPSPYIT